MKNGELKIESGIEIPARKHGHGKGHADALRQLKVSQSVVLPTNMNSATSNAARLLGKGKYAARMLDDSHTRIWRTK